MAPHRASERLWRHRAIQETLVDISKYYFRCAFALKYQGTSRIRTLLFLEVSLSNVLVGTPTDRYGAHRSHILVRWHVKCMSQIGQERTS